MRIKHWIGVCLPICAAVGLSLAIFWKIFIGLVPFPGSYLMAWYEPYKTETKTEETLGIAHKPVLDDVFRQLYPYKILTGESLRIGQLPFWNPYNGSGMPLLPVMHAGFFTPTTLLFVWLPGPVAWSIYIFLQPIILFLGIYWFARTLKLSKIASGFAASVFLLSGFTVVRYEFGEYLYVAAGLPFLLGIIQLYKEGNVGAKLFFIPFIIFGMICSGQPQMIFYVLAFALCYGIFVCIEGKKKWWPIAGMMLLGIGLGVLQLYPTLELYASSNMTHAASKFIYERFLLPFGHLVTLGIPNYFGNQATYNFWGAGDYVETALYVGTVPILFALMPVSNRFHSAQKYAYIFFLISTGFTILLALDWPLTRAFYTFPLPIISTAIPSRIFFLTTFSVAILAGIGWDTVKEKRGNPVWVVRIMATVIVLILLYTLFAKFTNVPCQNTVIQNCRTVAWRNTLLECLVFGIAATSLLFYRKIGAIALYISAAVYIISGLYNADKFLPFSPPSHIFPKSAVVEKLKEIARYDRIFGLEGATISTDMASQFNLFDPNYYDPLYLKRYGELVSYANTDNSQIGLTRSDVSIVHRQVQSMPQKTKRLLELLSVKNIFSAKAGTQQFSGYEIPLWEDQHWRIIENPTALPRVYRVATYEHVPDDEDILNRLFDPSFDPAASVILEQPVPEADNNPDRKNLHKPFAAIISYTFTTVEILTESDSDGFLVFTDNFYPCWKAFIKDREIPIYRANYTLRAVYVPKGRHIVTFSCLPYSLTIGCSISVIVFLVTGVLFVRQRKQNS